METQSRVIATLNKLKEQHSQKQKLGAIEDAIKEALDQMTQLQNDMNKCYIDLETELGGVLENISQEVDYALSSSASYQMQYDELKAQWDEMATDFDNNNISYNSDIVSELDDNINKLYEVANSLAEVSLPRTL
jgi:DNA repair ATPase RecN